MKGDGILFTTTYISECLSIRKIKEYIED